MMDDNNKTGLDGGSQQLNKIDAEEMAAAADGSGVECGICLDLVTEDGKRAWAKLQCNHQFHLDCIGSAFNAKGVMECPNCRKVEQGQWLFSNGRGNPNPFEFFHDDEWYPDLDMGFADFPDLSGVFSVGSSSSLLMIPVEEEHEYIPRHQNRRRHIHRRSSDGQQRATPVSNRNRAMSGRSVTTRPATRLTTHPNRLQRIHEAYGQQSSNPASTRASLGSSGSRYNSSQNSPRASFGAYGSRSNNSQNINTRIRNLPPIPYSWNHAATNHLQANSSLGRRDYYHHQEQVHDGYEYYEHRVRPQSMRQRRYEFEGSRHSHNQGRF